MEQTDDINPILVRAGQPAIVHAVEPSRVKGWLREPLFHFFLIGVALFIGYRLIRPALPQTSSNRIELTTNDFNQIQMSWQAQWQRAPTAAEMRGLIDERVRQEILFREGMALGLDQGDEIIKRRIAQKMEFIAEDVSTVSAPAMADLKVWYEKNSARFALPGLITFRHLYFSPDSRGPQARNDAARVLEKLLGNADVSAASSDRFMFQEYYADNSQEQVARVFGTAFAESILKLKTGVWQGPIESGLGWHLVRIEATTPGREPVFDEIDPSQLKSEWLSDQRTESKRQTFEAMKTRYEIILPAAK